MANFLSNLPCFNYKVLPWAILFFAALNVIFLGGKRRAFGGFIAVLREDFTNVSLTELNWIGDSYSALAYMSSSVSTAMIFYFNNRYCLFQFIGSLFILSSCITSSFVPNPHWLFLSHTLLHGIGSSLVLSTVGLVVNEHFDKKHSYHLLATTLISGGSVASIVFVTFFAYLIQQYNWRLAFLILGGMYFFVNALAAPFFQRKDEVTEKSKRKAIFCSCKDVQTRQIPLLILWFFDRVLTSVVTYGLLLNLTDYVHRTNNNLLNSTVLTTLFASGEAVTYLIGAIITAATKDFFKNKLRYILLITAFFMSILLIILEFTIHIQSVRRILCFLAGFTLGPSITFLFPAGEELTQLPGHIAYPFSLGGMGVGMMLSPLLSAKIAEVLMYKWFFLVQGCIIFAKFLCLLTITLLLSYYSSLQKDEDIKSLSQKSSDFEVNSESQDESSRLIPENKNKES